MRCLSDNEMLKEPQYSSFSIIYNEQVRRDRKKMILLTIIGILVLFIVKMYLKSKQL